jgi:hypothetical protein
MNILNTDVLVDTLGEYEALVLPDQRIHSNRNCDAIRRFVRGGGSLRRVRRERAMQTTVPSGTSRWRTFRRPTHSVIHGAAVVSSCQVIGRLKSSDRRTGERLLCALVQP